MPFGTFEQLREQAIDEGPEGGRPLPRRLKWALVILIIANIVAYAIVIVITVTDVDEQLSHTPKDNEEHIKVSLVLSFVHVLTKLLVGTARPPNGINRRCCHRNRH